MAQIIVNRTTYHANAESRLVRDVSNELALLFPNISPLITFFEQFAAKKKQPTSAMKYEWYQSDYTATWASVGNLPAGNSTASTALTVADGTLFVAGDLVAVPNAVGSSVVPEILRVTAVSSNVLTVVRGVGGTTVDTIASAASLTILGPAYEEGSSRPAAKMVAPTNKYNYIQTFRKPFGFSRQAMASATYAAPGGDYEREKYAKAREHQKDINNAFIWGVASESLTGGPSGYPIRTTGGLNSVITTNVVDGGTTLTEAKFREFCRTVVTAGGGSEVKYLLAAPLVADALDYWATSKLQMQITTNKYGLKIREVEMGGGMFMVVTDRSLANGVSAKNGFGSYAYAVDPEAVFMRYLSGNGVDGNTKYIEYDIKNQNGVDSTVGEYISDVGLQVQNEAWHGKLFNVVAYS